jgi:hypothetical protein
MKKEKKKKKKKEKFQKLKSKEAKLYEEFAEDLIKRKMLMNFIVDKDLTYYFYLILSNPLKYPLNNIILNFKGKAEITWEEEAEILKQANPVDIISLSLNGTTFTPDLFTLLKEHFLKMTDLVNISLDFEEFKLSTLENLFSVLHQPLKSLFLKGSISSIGPQNTVLKMDKFKDLEILTLLGSDVEVGSASSGVYEGERAVKSKNKFSSANDELPSVYALMSEDDEEDFLFMKAPVNTQVTSILYEILRNSPCLKILDLSNNRHINFHTITMIGSVLNVSNPSIQKIILKNMGLTEESVEIFIISLGNLANTLTIDLTDNLSSEALELIRENFPSVTILSSRNPAGLGNTDDPDTLGF